MKLIIGLGNIGTQFDGTRHNVGFAITEALAAAHGLAWGTKDKFKAMVAEGAIAGEKVIIAKPATYYNLVGEAARAIKDFYKIDDANILVVHDELALPFGTIRTRPGGSDAGNNGIKSIVAHLNEDIARMRIGIANDHLATIAATDFVLGRFTKDEQAQWPQIRQQALAGIEQFIDPNKKFEHTSVRIPA